MKFILEPAVDCIKVLTIVALPFIIAAAVIYAVDYLATF